jgi:general secretion pathway protein A
LRALRKIYRRTWGIPRVINILCDRCLLLGFASERKCITPRMVGKAARELQSDHRPMVSWFSGSVTRIFLPGILLVMLAIWSLVNFHLEVSNRQVSIPSDLEATTWSPAAASPVRMQDSVAAFNAIARVWQVPELAEGEKIGDMGDLWRAARDRGLEIRRVRGSLATLLQLNYPVLVKVKGGGDADLIAVLEETRGEFRVVPESGPLSRQGLNQLWNGEAYLLWRNDLDLPAVVLPGTRGAKVKTLQQLLSAAGGNELRIDGIYGRETSSSLAEFQRKQGLEPDEAVGMPTLLKLYQGVESFEVPVLRGGEGDEHSSQGAAEG